MHFCDKNGFHNGSARNLCMMRSTLPAETLKIDLKQPDPEGVHV